MGAYGLEQRPEAMTPGRRLDTVLLLNRTISNYSHPVSALAKAAHLFPFSWRKVALLHTRIAGHSQINNRLISEYESVYALIPSIITRNTTYSIADLPPDW
jgi:hypothetical protein